MRVIGEAENGQQALSFLERCAKEPNATRYPDLVLMDIRMPVMDGDKIALAIRAVYKGHTQMGPGLLEKALSLPEVPATPPPELALLTPRELDVLRLIAAGANNREIAHSLFLSENTVKNYVTNILNRLNVRDRTQAALLVRSLFDL